MCNNEYYPEKYYFDQVLTSNSLQREGSDWWCMDNNSLVISRRLERELSASITRTS